LQLTRESGRDQSQPTSLITSCLAGGSAAGRSDDHAMQCDTFPMHISLVPICRKRNVLAAFGRWQAQRRFGSRHGFNLPCGPRLALLATSVAADAALWIAVRMTQELDTKQLFAEPYVFPTSRRALDCQGHKRGNSVETADDPERKRRSRIA
jgi:hypothetical protein